VNYVPPFYKRIDGDIVEKYLWEGLTRLLAVYDQNDQRLMRFQYADARMPMAMTYQGNTYYLLYDQIGSLQMVVDKNGNVVKELNYDSFGSVINDSAPSFSIPLGFAGGLYDPDTRLLRFGYRDYDADVGRWTAKDPIFFSGGDTDLYGYVNSNPLNTIDLIGLFHFNAEYMEGGAAYFNFKISIIKLQATVDLGSQHYTLNGPNYVSQGVSISAELGPISPGLAINRTAPGESHGYSYDSHGRVIPGTGLTVNDILQYTPFEITAQVSHGIGSLEWAKITIGTQFLIGGQITLDFRDEVSWIYQYLDILLSDNPCGS
jgi:RHS repeat-associated protein